MHALDYKKVQEEVQKGFFNFEEIKAEFCNSKMPYLNMDFTSYWRRLENLEKSPSGG